jgi:AcrR family transcriptional regulator
MDNVLDTLPLRTRKPRGQGASRRGEILDAAKRLFIEEGFAQATMRRIAGAVGVSPTALYLHFSDKEAILRAIGEDFFEELLVALHETQNSDRPPLARLRAGMRCYVDFSLERADEYRLTFQTRNARALPECNDDKPDTADLSFAVLEHAVQQLLEAGIFRPGNAVLIAESIWCALHGTTAVLMDLYDRAKTGRDELIEAMIGMIIRGLASKEPDPV